MSRKNRLRRVHWDPEPVKELNHFRDATKMVVTVAVITAVVVGMVVGQMNVFG